MTTTSHQELVSALISRWPESHPQPSLERIALLCEMLGEPQRAFPIIQITGTNGKGSTAIMIESLLRTLGLRTGRFSSPHLVDVTERICIDGQPISAEIFDETWQQIAPMVEMVDAQLIGGVPLTFFEVITTMAYAAFADAPVDVAIIEVGMGGRWDATSVADADVAVITPVDLDHMHLLGSTVAEIAAEKAGIIKANSTAVFAGQNPEAAKVLSQRCVELGVPMVREGVEFALLDRASAVGGQLIRVDAAGGPVGNIFLPLYGSHMAHNAALAIAAVEAFQGGRPLAVDVIYEAFGEVRAPARLEVVHRDPTVVLDTAHNPHGVRATLTGFREAMGQAPVIAVVAMMADKAVDEVLGLLSDEVDQIVVPAIPDLPRALSVDELATRAEDIFGAGRVFTASTPLAAVQQAIGRTQTTADSDAAAAPVILVIGSVYLAGAVRPWLIEQDAGWDEQLRFSVPEADAQLDDEFDQW